jgi:putative transposase
MDGGHRQLKLLQRRLKKKQKGPANRRKLNQKIARQHQRIANICKDWYFKLSHHLCHAAGMMFVEDLNFRFMAKGMLGKHTRDAGLGQFVNQILPWVCRKCKKDLSVRISQCLECGSTKPRDIAAAQVICARSQRGIENACETDLAVGW